jgi:predicted nucleic acid-binding protein
MRDQIILDTGPLVAFLNSRDKHHDWAVANFGQIQPPLLTCEAVISEACFLLRSWPHGAGSVFELLDRKVLEIAFSLADQLDPVSRLLRKYANVPSSLADACLVRMAELHERSSVFTLDADFRIYRKHQRKAIPLLTPAAIGLL